MGTPCAESAGSFLPVRQRLSRCLHRFAALRGKNHPGEGGGVSFAEALVGLLADLRLRRYSPKTLESYANQLKRFGE